MSNNTNAIQSRNASATYDRLYQLHRNVAQLDAPYQLNQLPEAIRNQIFGQIFELSGRPRTNDPDWGRNNAFRDLHRLQTAIQNVAFNNFRAMPREQKDPIALRIWIAGGRQPGDANWGENHANDNVDILFRSIIEGMRGTPSLPPIPTPTIQLTPSIPVVRNNPQPSTPTIVNSSVSETLNARKRAALVRLGEMNNMGEGRINRFEPNDAISTFDLDVALQGYSGNHAPSRLCELLNWAGINDVDKAQNFGFAVRQFDGLNGNAQERMVRTFLSKIFSYVEQKINQGRDADEELKAQFLVIVDKIIDADSNCVDQTLSQLQDMLLDLIADDFTATQGGDRQLQRIQFRAGHALCKYRSHLLKTICVRQNPEEHHMADLERKVMQRLASQLGMHGGIFNAGAWYNLGDVDAKADRALQAFLQEYKPLAFLADDLRSPYGDLRKLRADFIPWAVQHYGISEEDEANVRDTDMHRALSANYDEGMTGPFADGGQWALSVPLLLMEAAGLIRPASQQHANPSTATQPTLTRLPNNGHNRTRAALQPIQAQTRSITCFGW